MRCISVKNLSVNYPVYTARALSLRVNLVRLGSAGRFARDAKGNAHIQALNDLSFDVNIGDRVALVGRNGAGKSTLLKVLAGIYKPTAGSVEITGTTAAILGLGIPFDEELSGYEVVKYAGIMKSVDNHRMSEVKQEIEEFTDLGDYLELPIRTYSSGMRMRLALALATIGRPEILLMDEGIGAGDQFFMDRARERSMRFMREASAMVIASHSEHLLREFCNKAILLDGGGPLIAGDIDTVMEAYARFERTPSSVPVILPGQSPMPCTSFCSGNEPGHPAHNAFDGTFFTHWRSPAISAARPNAHIGLQFEEPVAPRRVILDQWNAELSEDGIIRRFAIEASNDGFETDIRRAAVLSASMPRTHWNIPLSSIGEARWWRALALSPPTREAAGWAIARLEFDFSDDQTFATSGPISSACVAPAYDPSCAFFRETGLPWVSALKGRHVAQDSWIGWDYGDSRHISVTAVEIQQWDGGANPNTVSTVVLEYSFDGFESHAEILESLTLVRNEKRLLLTLQEHEIYARAWRIRATSGTDGGAWGIQHLRFLEIEELLGLEPVPDDIPVDNSLPKPAPSATVVPVTSTPKAPASFKNSGDSTDNAVEENAARADRLIDDSVTVVRFDGNDYRRSATKRDGKVDDTTLIGDGKKRNINVESES